MAAASADTSGAPEDAELALALADWRRRIATLYAEARAMEPEAAWRHWLGARSRLYAEHPQSPLPASARPAFSGIAAFPYAREWRLEAAVRPLPGGQAPPHGGDGPRPLAVTDGLSGRLGRELTLYWIDGYGGGLFLPFRDATSGAETYGGGRYLLDAVKGADLGATAEGRLILDFNFAYHPSCAHDGRWLCPLPPPENWLAAAVRAGERIASIA